MGTRGTIIHAFVLIAAVAAGSVLAIDLYVGKSSAESVSAQEAMAQTNEIKIGVLLASPPIFEDGPAQAMVLAQNAWNADAIPEIDTKLTLEFIDIRGNFTDPAHGAVVAQKMGAAAQDGYLHFIAPSEDLAALAVKLTAEVILPNSILVSPASKSTFVPDLYEDDNLFRLVPNIWTEAAYVLTLLDREGIGPTVAVADAELKPYIDITPFPDDLHEHHTPPVIPIFGPGDTDQNVQSLTELDDKLADLIGQHGEDRLAVYAFMTPPAFVTMADVLATNTQLNAIDDVKWFGFNFLALSPIITGDATAAAFADAVEMAVPLYEVPTNDINAHLAVLPAFDSSYILHNFAAYDAVHLLADTIAIGGAHNPDLKSVLYDVANNDVHALDHTDRTLGEGAMGDYMLDPETGDLIGGGDYVTYNVVRSGDGYAWAQSAPQSVCR